MNTGKIFRLVFVPVLLVIVMACAQDQVLAQASSDDLLSEEARRQTENIRWGGKSWPILETESFIIHFQPSMEPAPAAVNELDKFMVQTLDLLEADQLLRHDLQQKKLSYYLCDDATVTKLTGYQTKGMADLAGRAVISSHFPHFHELVHLLVHLMQETPPAQTHPLVQEGIACLLGGRHGRSPSIVLYMGWVHQNFGMAPLDEVLTQADFFSFAGGADVAYPIGALLCEVVRRHAGWGAVLELNRQLSGSAAEVASLNSKNVVDIIAGICKWEQGEDRQKLDASMAALWPEYRRCGILPLSVEPASKPQWKFSENGSEVMMWLDGEKLAVKVKAPEFPVYLISAPSKNSRGSSSLFTEHFPDRQYKGQRYALRCSAESISLYDLASNQLVAAWVAGFTDEMGACGSWEDGLLFKTGGHFSQSMADFMVPGSEIWQ